MKKVKSVIVMAAVIGLIGSSVHAGPMSVDWAATGAGFVTSGGAPLAIGSLVQVGYMTAGTAIGNFTPWASAAIGDNVGLAGLFSVSTIGDDTFPVAAGNKQIYMVAYNSVAPSSQYAIVTGPFAVAQWRFPLTSDFPNSTSIDLGGATSIVAGSVGPTYDVFGDGSLLLPTVATIPEPSTYVLVGTGLLGLVGLIRRRRS